MCLLPSACNPRKYGPDCALECRCQNGGTCNRFSGCICPSGWHGQHCEKSGNRTLGYVYGTLGSQEWQRLAHCVQYFCHDYNNNCNSHCDFGCQDRIPQIIGLDSHLEFNLGSEPVMICKATGNPPPVRDSIELRKPDGTVFTVRGYHGLDLTLPRPGALDLGPWPALLFMAGTLLTLPPPHSDQSLSIPSCQLSRSVFT